MRPDKERPAENTCRIVKGLDAVWAHFCPSKPCLPLSIDGTEHRTQPMHRIDRAGEKEFTGAAAYKFRGRVGQWK